MKAAKDSTGVSPKSQGALEDVDGDPKKETEEPSEDEMHGNEGDEMNEELKAIIEEVKESSEAITPNVVAKPVRLSQEEVDFHNLTHMPFRSWCEFWFGWVA